jgi:hypothetical protein
MSRLGTHSETEPIWAAVEVFSASGAMVGGTWSVWLLSMEEGASQAQGWVYGVRDKRTPQPGESRRASIYTSSIHGHGQARVRPASASNRAITV